MTRPVYPTLLRSIAGVTLCAVWLSAGAAAQAGQGEIRLHVTDPTGAAVQAPVELRSTANGFDVSLPTDGLGDVDFRHVPFGTYRLMLSVAGFAPVAERVEVVSGLPVRRTLSLRVQMARTTVEVTADNTLVDAHRVSSEEHIGEHEIAERVQTVPGREVQDLVNSQPGWLYEGNAVLHPRGSEYQTQFVLDGIPLTDNRSPGFGPAVEAGDVDDMSLYTAGFPAEFGRKMGGVVEIDTHRQTAEGLHGRAEVSGGSYDSVAPYAELVDLHGKDTYTASAAISTSDHYLNPVVPENYTNHGTTGNFLARYERQLTPADTLAFSVEHAFSHFLIPNEMLQELAGQQQSGDSLETLGTARYQRVLSPDSLLTAAGMVRNNSNGLNSNSLSTPIIATQKNYFNEGYLKADYALHFGNQEIKAGVEADNTFLHERFSYLITDPAQFDPDTPASLAFQQARADLEQAAFVEDLVRLDNWTVSAGLRYDHYQLLVNQNAFSPRLSLGRFLPSIGMVLHASYDRIFQTPSFENILISSSSQIDALSSSFLRLPVRPSHGNYYEGGLTQDFRGRLRLDANLYRRDVREYADDDQLLNTGVSYPISFARAVIYGAEGKLTLLQTARLRGYASYSYMVGNAWYPVTGGLFLGGDASAASVQLSGHFPDSQDQRNTFRARLQYQVRRNVWVGAGETYGSGLPFEFDGKESDALAEYGPQVISRVNFARGRVRQSLAISASAGWDAYQSERWNLSFQVDADNLNNRLNVIDFGGLFSGNAIAPARSVAGRVRASF